MQHGTCVTHVPWCMPGSPASSFLWSRWRGKRSRHSRRMRNPQFFVYVKRPMARWPIYYQCWPRCLTPCGVIRPQRVLPLWWSVLATKICDTESNKMKENERNTCDRKERPCLWVRIIWHWQEKTFRQDVDDAHTGQARCIYRADKINIPGRYRKG